MYMMRFFAYNDNGGDIMSILSAMAHGETQDLPNDVHNTPQNATNKDATMLTENAQHQKNVLAQRGIHPTLFYSEDRVDLTEDGRVVEDAHAVESRLEMKEEYPLG